MSESEPETELFDINDFVAFVLKATGKADKTQQDKDGITLLIFMTEALKQKVAVPLVRQQLSRGSGRDGYKAKFCAVSPTSSFIEFLFPLPLSS